MERYDYVIAGAGSAGCVLANRLSADPTKRVLLLEAGGSDWNPWIHVLVGYFKTLHNPKTDWRYKTEPDTGLNGRSIDWPRGEVLGGSSSINGLLYIRGQHHDYDHWRQLGTPAGRFRTCCPTSSVRKNRKTAPTTIMATAARFRSPTCGSLMPQSCRPSSRATQMPQRS